MIVDINKEFQIKSDEYNWIVNQKKVKGDKAKVKGEEFWETIGYVGTLGHAVDFIIERKCRVSKDIQTLAKEIEYLKADLRKAFDGLDVKR